MSPIYYFVDSHALGFGTCGLARRGHGQVVDGQDVARLPVLRQHLQTNSLCRSGTALLNEQHDRLSKPLITRARN